MLRKFDDNNKIDSYQTQMNENAKLLYHTTHRATQQRPLWLKGFAYNLRA